jgi:elongation factor P
MYSIAQLKVGTAIQVDGHPYVVTQSQFSKQARGGGVMKTTVKSLLTGNSLPMTFQGNDKVEPADITYSKAQYLYHQDKDYFFMNSETYEQFKFTRDDLGDQADFLIDGSEVDIQNFNEKPINVKLPPKVDLEVVEAPPAVKGDTAQGKVTKSIKLETGLSINAPIFIKQGDVVRINTETGEYCERVNK